MGNVCEHADAGCAHRIILRESDLHMENPSVVRAGLWPLDIGTPDEQVVIHWLSGYSDQGHVCIHEFFQVLLQASC